MDKFEFEVMFKVEDTLWWYQGMAVITKRVIEKFLHTKPAYCLDAGCGTGANIKLFSERWNAFGIDYSRIALKFTQSRKVEKLACASINDLPFPKNKFDLITSFDVLDEMSVNDQAALESFSRILAPDGILLLRLPAYPWLRGAHDKAIGIRERYTRNSISQKLQTAGLIVEHVSYVNMFLFPLIVLKRTLDRLFPFQKGSDLTLPMGPLNMVFKSILVAETHWVVNQGLPFGLTILAVARKPH